jgi:hypothetical protein
MPARISAARVRANERQRVMTHLEESLSAARAAHAGIVAAWSVQMMDAGDAHDLLQIVDAALNDAADDVRNALGLEPRA